MANKKLMIHFDLGGPKCKIGTDLYAFEYLYEYLIEILDCKVYYRCCNFFAAPSCKFIRIFHHRKLLKIRSFYHLNFGSFRFTVFPTNLRSWMQFSDTWHYLFYIATHLNLGITYILRFVLWVTLISFYS